MKKRRFFALFLVLGLLVSLLSVPASAFEEIDVDARAALLVEKETGEILYEKNAHEKNYPASITKLTVALLVFEAIDAGQLSLDQPITAHESAFEGLSIYGSTAGIKVGEGLTVEQLLQCMLIVSANEACNILAEAVCGEGNISQFVQRMNERAAALGCENTHYVNTSGLHDPDHYTTAWDIYLITRALMPYEKFMEICNSKSAEIAETDHNQRHVLHSTNRLISNWRELGYLYRDAQGIKTGSTEEAGHCLVSSAVRGDRQLVSVVLGAEKITLADGKSTLTKSFSETIRLFDYGFDCFSRREVVSADELVREVPVALSSEANYVVAHPAESITRMLPTELDLSELTRDITLPDSVDAPIAVGDELGEMTVSYNGTVYGTVKLLDEDEQARIRGLVINKFRGDVEILRPGLTQLEELTGKPVLGVVPYGHFDIDDEDSLSERLETKSAPALVNIAVVKLPRLSNFTDFSALSRVPGVGVRYADRPARLEGADLIILPGTKSTIADLRWLRESGMEAALLKAHAAGTPVFGICGGYQMMGRTVSDPENTEGGGSLRGIGLLPVETVFRTAKTTVQTHGTVADTAGVLHGLSGLAVEGYEIHMGETVRDADAQPFVTLKHGEHEVPDGCVTENACGTYLHGVFDAPEAAQRLAQALAERKGVTLEGAAEDPAVYRERQYDLLADTVRRSLDMQRIYDIMEGKA